ncbi:MAG: hypothetical protein ACK559_41980, partial [bacterium]
MGAEGPGAHRGDGHADGLPRALRRGAVVPARRRRRASGTLPAVDVRAPLPSSPDDHHLDFTLPPTP